MTFRLINSLLINYIPNILKDLIIKKPDVIAFNGNHKKKYIECFYCIFKLLSVLEIFYDLSKIVLSVDLYHLDG